MASSTSTAVSGGMDINQCISANELNKRLRFETLFALPCQNLPEVAQSFLNNNPECKNNETLTEHQVELLEIIAELRQSPEIMFRRLRKHFAKHFDIDLNIVAFKAGAFTLITKNSFEKKNKAFLLFHEDHTVHALLYDVSVDGTKQILFSGSDFGIELFVHLYIEELNGHRSSVTSVQPVVNHLDTGASDPSAPSTAPTSASQKVYHHISQLVDSLGTDPQVAVQVTEALMIRAVLADSSSDDIPTALNAAIDCLSQVVKIYRRDVPVDGCAVATTRPTSVSDDSSYSNTENGDNDSSHPSEFIPLPTEAELILSHGAVPSAHEKPMNDQICNATYPYQPPTLSKPLKSSIHPRTLKEFANTKSCPVQCVDSTQREPLHIGVPSADGVTLHLALMMCTKDDSVHPSKVVVPDKTKAEGHQLINNNDLGCLKFNECHPGDKFILEKSQIYSIVSPDERQMQQKDIRIHMLNLYQRGSLDRKTVQEGHLKQAKLALWFAICENEIYRRVSEVFWSNTIEERMSTSKATKRPAFEENQKVSTKKTKTS